jgi:serine/threonine-protein phosphatase 2A regulatory subunit A
LNCAELCKNVGEATAATKILPLFARLLKDKEAEVRQAAAAQMAVVAEECARGVLEHLVPVLDGLVTDPVQAVRVAFSKTVLKLAGPLGKEMAAKVLTPIILLLCKDEAYEVRNHVIENIDLIAEAVGKEGLQASLLPALLDLSKDPKWRVRMAVISKSSLLAKHLGVKSFEKKLQSVMINSLSDHVYAIRERSCAQIGEIVGLKEFGGKWAAERFFPAAFAIYDKTTNYLHRMTCLLVISACASKLAETPEIVEKHLLPLVLQACADDVPNVRLMAAKASKELVLVCKDNAAVAGTLKAALEKLTNDSDADAAFFSTQALRAFS